MPQSDRSWAQIRALARELLHRADAGEPGLVERLRSDVVREISAGQLFCRRNRDASEKYRRKYGEQHRRRYLQNLVAVPAVHCAHSIRLRAGPRSSGIALAIQLDGNMIPASAPGETRCG